MANLISIIDWGRVAEAIKITPQPMPDHEFEDAKKMVWTLAENFATRDANEFIVEGVERQILVGSGDRVLRGVVDVRGVVNSTLKPFNQFNGRRFIVDWKTSSNKLGTDWRARLVDSWQWRIYAYEYDAAVVIYRGVNRDEETNELIIEVPPTNRDEVEEYLEGGFVQREALVAAKLEVWPRIKKYSTCEAYGQTCPFYDDCRQYESIPRVAMDLRTMSYTQFENFYLCPERSRRMLLLGDGSESESSLLGKAVHRGMESVYHQMMVWRGWNDDSK